MIPPYYSVTITNLSRGWAESSIHLQGVDLSTVRRVLVDPFRARTSFRDGMIPGPMEAERVTFGMWARTVADEAPIELGDIVAVSVRIGAAGPLLFHLAGSRVTEVTTDLVPGSAWASRTTVQLTGFLADAASKFPTAATGKLRSMFGSWLWRMAHVGVSMGSSVGISASILGLDPLPLRGKWLGDSAETLFARLLNSWVPNGIHQTVVAYFNPASTAYPAGYSYAAGQTYDPPSNSGGLITDRPVDPVSNLKFLAVPAGRREAVTFALPLILVVDSSGRLTVTANPGSAAPRRHPALSASVCVIPATVRRRRDHIVNTVGLKGVYSNTNATYQESNFQVDARLEVTSQDASTRGNVGRDVDSMLILRTYDNNVDTTVTPPLAGVTETAQSFLSDLSVLTSTLAYERLDVLASDMPQSEAVSVLPYLMPHIPGRPGGDGRVVRHVTVYGVSPDVNNPATVPGGFITAAELVIEKGRMSYILETTPGRPLYPGTQGPPVTVSEFRAVAVAGVRVDEVDQTLNVGDFANID